MSFNIINYAFILSTCMCLRLFYVRLCVSFVFLCIFRVSFSLLLWALPDTK